MDLLPAEIETFLIAGGIGLLIGLERERVPSARAGLRTFGLVGLFGALMAFIGTPLGSAIPLGIGLAVVGLMIVAAYLSNPDPQDPGTTSVAALLLCYGLGAATALGYAKLSVMLGVATTALLYFKAELRGIARRLSDEDWISILQFAVLALVILPILPNEEFGPYGAINPYHVWWLVVLLSGVGLVGYAALQIAGPRFGVAFVGLCGGLVSSTATTLVYARQARETPGMARAAALIILLANLVMVIRVTVVAALVAPAVAPLLAGVVAPALGLGLLGAAWSWRQLENGHGLVLPATKNPVELKMAVGFGLLYGAVLLCAAWLADKVGNQGVYVLAFVSGLTDVDAITLSTMRLLAIGQIAANPAVTALLIAIAANLAFKATMAFMVGGRALGGRIVSGMAAVALGVFASLGWLLAG